MIKVKLNQTWKYLNNVIVFCIFIIIFVIASLNLKIKKKQLFFFYCI